MSEPERWPETVPAWPAGTDIKIVYDWEYVRQCLYCFTCLCEYCEGGATGDGRPCQCGNPAHAEEYSLVE